MNKTSNVKKSEGVVSREIIQSKIYLIRGQKVMLDKDLAQLYGVTTKRFNEQVKRNVKRFPEDFMFKLTPDEFNCLRSQFATSKIGRGGRRYMPFAFTEQGVAMLSSVLNSDRAIEVNIQIMRVFTKLRQFMLSHKDLALKIEQLEVKVGRHDQEIRAIFEAIKRLMSSSNTDDNYKRTKIGFIVNP